MVMAMKVLDKKVYHSKFAAWQSCQLQQLIFAILFVKVCKYSFPYQLWPDLAHSENPGLLFQIVNQFKYKKSNSLLPHFLQ